MLVLSNQLEILLQGNNISIKQPIRKKVMLQEMVRLKCTRPVKAPLEKTSQLCNFQNCIFADISKRKIKLHKPFELFGYISQAEKASIFLMPQIRSDF